MIVVEDELESDVLTRPSVGKDISNFEIRIPTKGPLLLGLLFFPDYGTGV